MKFALGFFSACFFIILGIFIFAPEQAHKIIDEIHGKPVVQPDILEDETERNEGKFNVPGTASESGKSNVVRKPGEPKPPPDKPVNSTEAQLLSYFKIHKFDVEEIKKSGLYLISSSERKKTSSEPSEISITGDGLVVTHHNPMFSFRDSSVKSGQKYVSDRREDGITITASVTDEPDEDGYWWVETIRSFYWNPTQDDREQVESQAEAIRSMGFKVTEGSTFFSYD